MDKLTFEKQLEREKKKNSILANMVEDQTRELYLEQMDLRKANQDLDRILQTMTAAVIVTGPDLRVSKTNVSAVSLLGYTLGEMHGKPMGEVLPLPEIIEITAGKIAGEIAGKLEKESVLHRKSDGKSIPIYFSLTSIEDGNDDFGGVICLVFDISIRKELEMQLLQAQKLQSIGQLAAGIAHEINTPIQFIGDNTRFLKDEFVNLKEVLDGCRQLIEVSKKGEDSSVIVKQLIEAADRVDTSYLCEEIPKAIQQSLDGIERVTRLVRAMKEFSHPGSTEKQHIDINKAIESTIIVSTNEWKYVAEVETRFDRTLPLIPCLPGEFNQVILNLVVNSAHAIAEANKARGSPKGRISVSTNNVSDHVEIRLQDNGAGIPQEITDKIFNPFFTTKEVGKGTGQGLAIARSIIVNKHGGTIEFDSEVGKGTTFIICLPFRETILASSDPEGAEQHSII